MRKLLVILVLVAAGLGAQGQKLKDTIVSVTGDTISCKIVFIDPYGFRYKAASGAKKTISLEKISLFYTRKEWTYVRPMVANKAKESSSSIAITSKAKAERNKLAQERQGDRDAWTYYDKTGPGTATYLMTIGFAPVGLIGGSIIASVPPKPKKLHLADEKRLQNPHYYNAFYKRAHKIKIKMVAKNFGLGIITNLIAGSVYLVLRR